MTDQFDAIARTEVQAGWDVYSVDEDRVGTVDEVSDDGFTVSLTGGDIARVQFGDIESADEGRVDLTLAGDELRPTGHPPPHPEPAEGAEEPGDEAVERPPRPSQAEGARDE